MNKNKMKIDNNKKHILKSIIKECYWDYNITEDDILKIVNSDQFRLKQKLFDKIIYNSKDKLMSLSIFKKDELIDLFNSFSNTFNKKYSKRHILVLRNILLNEKNVVAGLEWKKR